jgi:hypothetical protein
MAKKKIYPVGNYYIETLPSDEIIFSSNKHQISLTQQETQTAYYLLDSNFVRPARIAASSLNTNILEDLEDLSPSEKQESEAALELKRRFGGKNVALLDSTTLKNASSLLTEEAIPSAFTLFDLMTFVNAVVLYDKVYVTHGADLNSANKALDEEVFRPIDILTRDEDDFLYYLSNSVIYGLEHISESDLSTLKSTWAVLLDKSDREILFDWSKAEAWIDTPGDFHKNPFYKNFASPSLEPSWTDLISFVSISTYRTLYNVELSRRFGIPYLANSARGPIESFILQLSKRSEEQFHIIMDALEKRLFEEIGESVSKDFFPKTPLEYRSPIPFAALVSQLNSISDFYPSLTKLRELAKPYRHKVYDWYVAYEGGDLKAMERLSAEIGFFVNNLNKSFGVDLATQVVKAIPDIPMVPKEATKTLAALKVLVIYLENPILRRLYTRIRMPYFYFLANLKEQARQMLSVQGAVRKLWKRDVDLELFNRIVTSRSHGSIYS